MSKSKRIDNRIERLEKRFRKQIAKGKKGTDMDIELHERRIQRLKDKSPLNFLVPNWTASIGSSNADAQNNIMGGIFGGNAFGSMNAHQWVINQMQQQNQNPQSTMSIPMAAQDPNNASATGLGDNSNMMMNPGEAQVATGNAPNNTITAGMAIGDAPIATAGNFNPQTVFSAKQIYGNQANRDRAANTIRKPLINL